MIFFWQSLFLLLSFLFIFLLQRTILADYIIQLLIALGSIYILLCVITSFIRRRFRLLTIINEVWSILFLNTIIILLIIGTGIFSSPLFFLLYFLIFGIALAFDPKIVFVFLTGCVLILFEHAIQNDVVGNFIRIGSLLLAAPFAFIFGKDIHEREKKTK